jgi:hypothetical protein
LPSDVNTLPTTTDVHSLRLVTTTGDLRNCSISCRDTCRSAAHHSHVLSPQKFLASIDSFNNPGSKEQ